MSIEQTSSRRLRAGWFGRRIAGIGLDAVAFGLSGALAFELRFDGVVPGIYLGAMFWALSIWLPAKLTAFVVGKLDRQSWSNASAYEAVQVILANSAGAAAGGLILHSLLGPRAVPRSVYILDWLLSCLLTVGSRLVVHGMKGIRTSRGEKSGETRTLIYGAGAAGLALLWETRQNQALRCDMVGLVDDDPSKAHLILLGKPVLGTGEDLGALARKHAIKRVLIAVPSATAAQMMRILKIAIDAGVEYKTVPGLGEIIQNAGLGKQLRAVSVEDLLERKQVHLQQDSIRRRIQGKVVMVTGAAGSIGSEICRQIARFNPLALVAFDEAETPLFKIELELRNTFPGLIFHTEIGSITNPAALRNVMRIYQPSAVYHAAAYKHVSMMERHVFAAVENNIFGTWNVAQAAVDHGVQDFVMISTDKAACPTSMMGATKRVAELVIHSLQKQEGTRFVAVRFGNVLGSSGSVVPIFKQQIAAGGPVTVTHPDMTRYFMTAPEAAQLVLQAQSIGKGGEAFVLDMGEPVRIVDLARNLILLSGLEPDRDIQIQFGGLRPGEKLYEDVNLLMENSIPTSHPQIRVLPAPSDFTEKQMRGCLNDLQEISNRQDVGCLLLLLKELVPEYQPAAHLLCVALTARPRQRGQVRFHMGDISETIAVSQPAVSPVN